ncbi:hypothetical protein CC86DRAFT_368090, partial [Ophiobolus disseminans]
VERTQWLLYLVGIERADLIACIEELAAEPDLRSDNKGEPVEALVIKRVGVFVRLEAIRTEKH